MSMTKAEYEYFIARNGTVLTHEVANKLYGLGRLAEEVYLADCRIAQEKREHEAKVKHERDVTLDSRETLELWMGRV